MRVKGKGWLAGILGMSLVLMLGDSGCRKPHAADPFPLSGQVAGWEKTGNTRVFAAQDLWQYIDGDAEQYVQAGVVSTSTADYRYEGKLETVVDVYTMKDSAGARKMLESGETHDAASVPVGDAGVAFAQSVTFRKGPYLVRIVAYQAPPDARHALIMLAHAVEAKL